MARRDSLCTQRTVPFRGAGTRSGGGARGASPVHSRPQVRRQAGPAVRSVDGLCPRPELENCAREPPRAHHPLCETAVGRWPRPLGHVSAAAFLPAPPRPAEPVSLLSSAALRAPGACCPVLYGNRLRRAHETRRRWQFGRHIGITCGAQGCASGLCPGRSRAPRGAPAHLVLQSSVPGSSQSLALRDERSPGTKAAARGV